ncbi:MAG TPA: NAD-dependent epimerase/dehydratase family protein [Myxococcota bacterium]|nr:NAD-dependent epimerase/dehydratase family protein [Myxococcota bacterium]
MSAGAGRHVLVTGGSGFLGGHIVRALVARGDAVTIFDRAGRAPCEGAAVEAVDLLEEDVTDRLAEGRYDAVFHLAGNVEIPLSVAHPDRDFLLNAGITVRLLEALRQASPTTRLLLASTAAVYGEALDGPCPESQTPAPVAPYGASKWVAECYVELYARRLGLATTRARIFSMYGPRLRKHVVFDLIEKVERRPERLEVLGDGAQVRDFVFVEDAVRALLCVADRAPHAGEAVNVASGVPVTIAELAAAVVRAAGAPSEIAFVGGEAPGRSRRWMADVSRLRGLGHRSQVPLDEGLARTVAWYRESGAGR